MVATTTSRRMVSRPMKKVGGGAGGSPFGGGREGGGGRGGARAAIAPGPEPGLFGGDVRAAHTGGAVQQAAAEQLLEPEALQRGIGGEPLGLDEFREGPSGA